MKITMNELRDLVGAVLSEAGKSKKKRYKGDAAKYTDQPNRMQTKQPHEYKFEDVFDFSAPLGADNLYRQQGAAGWGPSTAASAPVDDGQRFPVTYGEGVDPSSEWSRLVEERGIWESLDSIIEKQGFKKVKGGKPKKGAPPWFMKFKKGKKKS